MADMHMPHVPSGTKIGKHSVWLWGSVLAGVVVIYIYYSRSSSGTDTASNTSPGYTTSDGSLMGDSGNGGTSLPSSGGTLPVSSGGSGPSGSVDSTGGTTTDGTAVDPTTDPSTDPLLNDTAPPDNFTWEGAAVAYLIKHGVSGIHAQQAIEKYLNGDTLTYQQATWMNAVIASSGIAPDGVNATPSYLPKPKPHVATPHPKPKPKPKAHHTTTVKHPAETHHTVVKHPAQTKHTVTHTQAKAKPKPKPKVTIRRRR